MMPHMGMLIESRALYHTWEISKAVKVASSLQLRINWRSYWIPGS
jgi:hypothetical protein